MKNDRKRIKMSAAIMAVAIMAVAITAVAISGDFFSLAAAEPETDAMANSEKTRREMVDYGVDYLRSAQSDDGGFSPETGIGPTTVVLLGLMKSGLGPDDPTVAKGLAYLQRAIHQDGGIYSPGGQIASYESCLALACFHLAREMDGTDRYKEIVENAESYLRGQQYNEKNGTTKDDVYYGGVGYGNQTRPDLSNTQFFIETLHDLGAGADDPAIVDALVFVSRCQNLESEANPSALAATNSDGGFIYTCVGEGNSPAGQETSGGLRSYGSITYAGLKSLIYAGLTPDDPRVAAASGWIRENYSLTENPGLGRRGLYYYYNTMSKTLRVLGGETITDASGAEHHWRDDLIQTLADAQNPDGSWVNDDRMWRETDPNLVTGYALLVLANCQEKEKKEETK